MEIQVDRLRQALELVAPALPKGKVTLPITTAVLFQNGKLTATNLEIWISVDLPELGRSRTGFVLRHRALTETLKYVPGHQVLTITPERANVVLQTTGSRTSLVKPGHPRDFPPLPEPSDTGGSHGFLVDGDRLVRGLLEVLPYAATKDTVPVLTSVAMKLDYELELVTADGFRLAIYQPGIQLSGEGIGHQALVPAATVHALSQLWRKADKTPDMDAAKAVGEAANRGSIAIARLAVARRNLRMVEDGGHITFSFGSVTLCSQLLQGEFPRYQQLVPETEGGSSVSVSAEELARVVNQVASIAGEGSNMARLQWSGEQLTVLAQAVDVGETQASIPAHVAGGDGEIAFNLGYLQQYLRGKTHVVPSRWSLGSQRKFGASQGSSPTGAAPWSSSCQCSLPQERPNPRRGTPRRRPPYLVRSRPRRRNQLRRTRSKKTVITRLSPPGRSSLTGPLPLLKGGFI